MFEFLIYLFVWCFAIYGILVLIQDIFKTNTYKKVEKNVKIIITVKNVEDGIESYIRKLLFGMNFYNNLVVIDLGSTDGTLKILQELEEENINLKVLNKSEGINYLMDI